MQSKDEIELAVFESFRELLLAVRVFWFRLAERSTNSLMGSPSFTPVSTAHTNKHTINKKKEIKVLPLSSN